MQRAGSAAVCASSLERPKKCAITSVLIATLNTASTGFAYFAWPQGADCGSVRFFLARSGTRLRGVGLCRLDGAPTHKRPVCAHDDKLGLGHAVGSLASQPVLLGSVLCILLLTSSDPVHMIQRPRKGV